VSRVEPFPYPDKTVTDAIARHLAQAKVTELPWNVLRLGGHLPPGLTADDIERLEQKGLVRIERRPLNTPFRFHGSVRQWRQLIISLPSDDAA
jgi:hypothetical protein